ncbi:MAG: hypothetical protein PHP51_08170 [Desulfotomaculaceae bacterium]|nr:hypothetical protein [Desulfotomaculaceae bacterium]MDD4768090.1 hypothetical protein [Desulfotomaculaceae bacterium]
MLPWLTLLMTVLLIQGQQVLPVEAWPGSDPILDAGSFYGDDENQAEEFPRQVRIHRPFVKYCPDKENN